MWYALSISNNSCIIHIVSCLYFITKQYTLLRNKSKTSLQITLPKYCTECFVFCETYSVWCPGAGTEAGPQSDIARIQLPYYSEVRHITELPTLSERHRKRCLNFASGLAKSNDFGKWFKPSRKRKCHLLNLRNNNNLSTMPTKSGRFSSSIITFFY